MRDILFRGKRIDNGEWVYGWFEMYPFGRWPVKASIIPAEDAISGHYEHIEVDPSTVGQYTGLTDKNGKRIFEGDVFEWGYAGVKEFKYTVVYDAELTSFVGERRFGFVSTNGVDLEIIGNIHDNPELMEG